LLTETELPAPSVTVLLDSATVPIVLAPAAKVTVLDGARLTVGLLLTVTADVPAKLDTATVPLTACVPVGLVVSVPEIGNGFAALTPTKLPATLKPK
jgi:hypothetical protein